MDALKAGLKKYAGATFVTILYLIFRAHFNQLDVYKPEFAENSFLYQCFYFHGCFFVYRVFFYTAMLWNESSLTCAGFSYNGKDKNNAANFDKMIGC
jgi:hypothetical protein